MSHDVTRRASTSYVLPAIPDDAPPRVRESLARRRITAVDGVCPCGGQLTRPNRAERRAAARSGRPARAVAAHEPDCPALDARNAG